ncbi:MAG: hypothetical protein IKV94_02190 [Clostridia bacterium]|nr:hypothetical protein [Clostridia bacterium]
MKFYDKIKNPLDNEETLKGIIKCFAENKCDSSGELYNAIVKYNDNQIIDSNEYMEKFDEYIYWPSTENDWENISKEIEKTKDPRINNVYHKYSSYKELYNYIDNLDAETRGMLEKYVSTSEKQKEILKQQLKEMKYNVEELITTYSLYNTVSKWHDEHAKGLMGFHFDSQKHDKTAKKMTAEIKYYINAGADSYKVAKLFLDKCREENIDSYYFKVADPMHKEENRNDKLCIYSDIEHAGTFLDFLTQIKKENPEISFNKPPMMSGVINDFIGIGADKQKGDESYNEQMSNAVYEVLTEFYNNNNIKSNEILDFVNNNPNMLGVIKEQIAEKCEQMGFSKDKICIPNEFVEKLKKIEISNDSINKESNEKVFEYKKTPKEKLLYETINPELLKKQVTLPNGRQISFRQYVQEVVEPLVPENGKFKLKSNGNELSAKQFIEEIVFYEGQEKYNGDINALLEDRVASDDDTTRAIEKVNGVTPAQAEKIEQENKSVEYEDRNKSESVSKSFFKSLATKHGIGTGEVKKSAEELSERQEVFRLSLKSKRSEEEQQRYNELQQKYAKKQLAKRKSQGQTLW